MQIFRSFKNIPPIEFTEEENANFAPFVCLKGLFNDTETERIKGIWGQHQTREGLIEDKILAPGIRKSTVQFIDPLADEWIYNKLEMACILTNLNRYKFDLRGFESKLQLTQYTDGGFYGWHMDCGNGKSSLRKLSITVQLSEPDDYEGGDLQFFRGNNLISAPKEKGTAILFPSYMAHRVEPVQAGCRMSIVGWIGGPPYR